MTHFRLDEGSTVIDVITVGIDQLVLSPARSHGYVAKPTRTLQQRIAKHGVLDPISVRPIDQRRYEILSNPTIWVAAGQAGIFELPVTVHTGISDAEAAAIVADHYQAPSLNPIDEAQGFADELDAMGGRGQHGVVTQLADRLGIARNYIYHALRLLELPVGIQALIERGELSVGQARPLITVPGRIQQQGLAKRIVAECLSARDVERLARELRHGRSQGLSAPSSTAVDADVQRLQQRVSELVGSPFEIRGNEAIFNFFGDYEVLDGLLGRLGYRSE